VPFERRLPLVALCQKRPNALQRYSIISSASASSLSGSAMPSSFAVFRGITFSAIFVRAAGDGCCARAACRTASRRDELAPSHSITSSARASSVVGTLRPMPSLPGRLIFEDQPEQEMHVAAVGSAFRRLGSIGSPHLAQVPYVPSDIRFRAASI